jgi:hypothetical protein
MLPQTGLLHAERLHEPIDGQGSGTVTQTCILCLCHYNWYDFNKPVRAS